MAQLTGKTVAAINHLAIDDDTRADTRTQRNLDEVLHTTGSAISHLTDGGGVGVVGHTHGNTQALREHVGQWHDTVVAPNQVWCKLDGTRIVVGVRSADTHRLNLVDATNLLNDHLQSFD